MAEDEEEDAEDEDEEDDLAAPMPELDDLAVEGDDPVAKELDPAILRRFLSSQKALDVAAAAIKPIVPAQQVGDLAAEAVIRALNARKPRVEVVIPGWLAVIARRVAARWLEKKERRAKYEGPMPVRKAREDDYTGHKVEQHAPPMGNYFDPDGPEDEEEMLEPFMDKIVAPHDRAILEVLREQARTKKTYAALAAARGESEDQLWRKIRRFKTKYRPRVRKRRAVMLWLKKAAVRVAVGIVVAGSASPLPAPPPPCSVGRGAPRSREPAAPLGDGVGAGAAHRGRHAARREGSPRVGVRRVPGDALGGVSPAPRRGEDARPRRGHRARGEGRARAGGEGAAGSDAGGEAEAAAAVRVSSEPPHPPQK